MNIIFPSSIGDRTCDRAFMLMLSECKDLGCTRAEVLGWILLVWKDFALSKDERRKVPQDAELRKNSPVVRIIEDYIGWTGGAGEFVRLGIDSGFFVLVPCDSESSESWLVLADFFPANQEQVTGVSQQKRASHEGKLKRNSENALHMADEQMRLFKANKSPILSSFAEADVSAALTVIACICNCMNWKFPADGDWRQSLIAKTIDSRLRFKPEEMKALYLWLQNNRANTIIPPRIDLLLGDLQKFIDLARRDFTPTSVLDKLDPS
jgi:hypothetical protein